MSLNAAASPAKEIPAAMKINPAINAFFIFPWSVSCGAHWSLPRPFLGIMVEIPIYRCKDKSIVRKEKGRGPFLRGGFVWRSRRSDVQVWLVHRNALPAAFFCSSLSESGR